MIREKTFLKNDQTNGIINIGEMFSAIVIFL